MKACLDDPYMVATEDPKRSLTIHRLFSQGALALPCALISWTSQKLTVAFVGSVATAERLPVAKAASYCSHRR